MQLGFFEDYTVCIVVGICLCVGYVIKALDVVPNKYIPLIMAVLGVGLNAWLELNFSPTVILGGMFSGLASTGLHQVFKQLIEKGKADADE